MLMMELTQTLAALAAVAANRLGLETDQMAATISWMAAVGSNQKMAHNSDVEAAIDSDRPAATALDRAAARGQLSRDSRNRIGSGGEDPLRDDGSDSDGLRWGDTDRLGSGDGGGFGGRTKGRLSADQGRPGNAVSDSKIMTINQVLRQKLHFCQQNHDLYLHAMVEALPPQHSR
jgi:hypothetical protein